MIFNVSFDNFYLPSQPRSFAVRAIHTISFELGMLLFTIPTTMHVMDIKLVTALFIDASFMLFFLVYTYLFNLIWDRYRARWFKISTQQS